MQGDAGEVLAAAQDGLRPPPPALGARQHLLVRQELVGHGALHIQEGDGSPGEPGCQPAGAQQLNDQKSQKGFTAVPYCCYGMV